MATYYTEVQRRVREIMNLTWKGPCGHPGPVWTVDGHGLGICTECGTHYRPALIPATHVTARPRDPVLDYPADLSVLSCGIEVFTCTGHLGMTLRFLDGPEYTVESLKEPRTCMGCLFNLPLPGQPG